MKQSIAFTRLLYFLLSIVFLTSYAVAQSPTHELTAPTTVMGIILGGVFGLFLFGLDSLFRKYPLRSLTTATLGLFIGYLLGSAIVSIFQTVVNLTGLKADPGTLGLVSVCIFLSSTYLAVMMTIRAAEEIVVSIPFLRLTPRAERKKDIVLDSSVLQDVRIIDLANSGLIDNHLIVPRAFIKELYTELDGADDSNKIRARKSLETLKKLEASPGLNLRYNDTDFPEVSDPTERLSRLARLLDANILSGDNSRLTSASQEGVRYINLNTLANALKPITQSGETLEVKIQRHGKEPRQGVGYLEDGTMVVVNGGGEFLGETIRTHVLSVKHTSSGRMIFCNAQEEHDQARSASRREPATVDAER